MRCAKHNNETAVTCGRCEAPVCPKCMVHTDVGVRCKSCSPPAPRRLGISRGATVLGAAVLVILAIVAVGALSGGGPDAEDYLGGYPYSDLPAPDITVERIVDPWTDDEGEGPSEGHRFVAIELVVEGTSDDPAMYGYVDPYYMKLTDSEGFAYPVSYEGPKPMLSAIDLEPSEKTRGWVTFEVAVGSDVKSLSYAGEIIALP